LEELMQNQGLIRNRKKMEAAIKNAKIFMEIQTEFGSFSNYLWSFTDGQIIVNQDDDFPVKTPLSDNLSKDLKKRGMGFVGSVTIYSYLQAVGVVNDHELSCFCRESI
jgi:DNA-3-methyladenine glycosylase I